MTEDHTVRIVADTNPFRTALQELEVDAERFGSTLTSALKGAVISGKNLEDTLKGIGKSLASSALDAALKPFESMVGGFVGSLVGGLTPFARGGVPGLEGIASTPTFFGVSGKLGVMGEAGPEAVMPLSRGSDGRLGVAASSGGTATQVHVTIHAADAASVQRSETQVSTMLARAVRRGARHL